MADNEETKGLTKNDKTAIFINTIQKTYGVGCAPNSNPAFFTIQRPFVDSWGVFGKGRDILFKQEDIQPVWGALLHEEWDFDYDNPYVQQWIGIGLI